MSLSERKLFIIANFQKSIILIALVMILLKILTGNPAFIIITFSISSVSFLLLSCCRNNIFYFLLYFSVIFYVLFFGLYHVESEDKNYILYIMYITLAIQLSLAIRKMNFDYQAAKFVLTITLCWTFYHISRIGYNPDAYNNLLDGSRNYISAHLVIFLAYYLFSCKKRVINVNLVYPALVVICCFFLFGRSGIALSIFLFFTALSQKKIIIKVLFFISLINILFFFRVELFALFNNSNFSHGVESERSIMFSEYLSSMSDWRNFLFGVDFKYCCETIMAFKVNPHNSFINLHSRFGILPFFAGFIVYVYMFFKRRVMRNLMVNILILVVFARYFADSIGFFGIIDFILFSMFVYVLFDESKYYRENSLSNDYPQSVYVK